jgi:hypothetical protein
MKTKNLFETNENLIFSKINSPVQAELKSRRKIEVYYRARENIPKYYLEGEELKETGSFYKEGEIFKAIGRYTYKGKEFLKTSDGYFVELKKLDTIAHLAETFVPYEIEVTIPTLNVRNQPFLDDNIYGKLSQGARVWVYQKWINVKDADKEPYWYRIRSGPYQGKFISAKYVKSKEEYLTSPSTPPSPPPPPSDQTKQIVKMMAIGGIGIFGLVLLMSMIKRREK